MNRRARKKLKLQARGTYHRADQWRLDKQALRCWAAGVDFCRALEAHTGKPCEVEPLMQGLGFIRDQGTGRVTRLDLTVREMEFFPPTCALIITRDGIMMGQEADPCESM